MFKKLTSVIIAAIMACSLFGGCFLFDSSGNQPAEKVQITIDSLQNSTLNEGDTYMLIYSLSQKDADVKIDCTGKFNFLTNVFTADRAGQFEIKLSVGSGETYSEAIVNITVIAAGDKSELIRLVNSTSSYLASDYSNYDTLTAELVRSNAVINKEHATQAEINAAIASLQSVCDKLSPVSFRGKLAVVYENSIVYGEDTYIRTYYTNFNLIAAKIKAVNADSSIKVYSAYDAKIKSELQKFKRIDGKELAKMNFERGTAMAEKVFNSYYTDHAELSDWGNLGMGSVVYDVLDKDGNHVKNTGTGNKETDFWTLTSFLSLMVRLDTVTEASYKSQVDKVIDAMAYHRGTRDDNALGRAFRVYGVHRSKVQNQMDVKGFLGRESVFDDQIWAAQEFLNAYNLYKDNKYLDIAKELTEYIYLIGRCETGGIYWGQGYTTRHACSSAPFVKLAVMLSEATNNKEYLDWAKDVYDWTYKTLRDPKDNLYYDLIGTRFQIESKYPDSGPDAGKWENPKNIPGNKVIGNGSIDDKKYSYNSGSMISAGIALYKATGEKKYLTQAQATAQSCRSYFGKEADGYVVYPGSDGGTTYSWFDLILFKGYFDLYTVDKTASKYLDDVQQVYDHDYDKYYQDGFMPTTGLIGWTSGRNSYDYRVLMDHATNTEVMLLLGQFKNI